MNEVAQQAANTPWGTILAVLGPILATLAGFILYYGSEIRAMRCTLNGIVTGEAKTKDGEKIKIINGFQDEKIKEIESTSNEALRVGKANSDEIEKLKANDEAIIKEQKELRKLLKGAHDENEKLGHRVMQLIGDTGELVAGAKFDRENIKEMFGKISEKLGVEVGK